MTAIAAVPNPPTEAPPATLIAKLAAVMAAVERVPKSGWNDFHKYHYATEADLSDAVRSNLARYGVMLIPSVEKVEWRDVATKSGSEKIATLTVKFTATDGTDRIEFNVIGEGQDRGDKATYKAMTGAMKYALLKLFLIPTGDDPEKEEEEARPHRQAPAKPAARPPPAPATAHPNVAAAAETLGGKVEAPKSSAPPPYVMALWERLKTQEHGNQKLAKAMWDKAAEACHAPVQSSEWSKDHAAAVEAFLWPSDVP